MAEVIVEDEFLAAAETIRVNAEIRRRIDEEDERAKEILAKVLTDGDTAVSADGEPLVKMRRGALVFNEEQARKALPPETLALVTVTITESRVDKKLCQDILGDAVYAKCCRQNKSSVVPA